MGLQQGNPDWQRRYSTSAQLLVSTVFNDNADTVLKTLDSQGFQYLLVTMDCTASAEFSHALIEFYMDSTGSTTLMVVDWTTNPGYQFTVKVPVAARYYGIRLIPVAGTTGHQVKIYVEGTNGDQENILTQNTAIPQQFVGQSIGAGVNVVKVIPGIFGGRVHVSVVQGTNNMWVVYMEYYDYTVPGWNIFWAAYGADKGLGWSEDVVLPYAPTRLNVSNTDNVAHSMDVSVIVP